MVDMFIYFTLSSRRNFTRLCNESHNENAGFDVKDLVTGSNMQ